MKPLGDPVFVPLSMRLRPKDKRGIIIPFSVYTNKKGEPEFTVLDPDRVRLIRAKKLCSMCGQKMKQGYWFIGGKRCFTDWMGAFVDGPQHLECGVYALRVCPYLAAPRYSKRLDDKLIDYDALHPGMKINIVEQMNDSRPEVFGLGWTDGYDLVPSGEGSFFYKAQGWKRIEYWQHGEVISPIEGTAL